MNGDDSWVAQNNRGYLAVLFGNVCEWSGPPKALAAGKARERHKTTLGLFFVSLLDHV